MLDARADRFRIEITEKNQGLGNDPIFRIEALAGPAARYAGAERRTAPIHFSGGSPIEGARFGS